MCTVTHATTMKSSAPLVYGTLVRSAVWLLQASAGAYCQRRSRVKMSAQSIHSTARNQGRDRLLGTPVTDHALGALALAAGYYATAQLGESLAFPLAPVSALWLPNALVMGALLLAPRRFWWFYLVAVLPAHLLVQLPLPDVTIVRVVIQYVLNCGTALIGAIYFARPED